MVIATIQSIDEQCRVGPAKGEKGVVEVEGDTLYDVCDQLPGTLGELVRRGEDFLAAQRAAESGGGPRRSVWEIAAQPFAKAHFATFPLRLVLPCVIAGSSPKAWGECGAPWERVTKRTRTLDGEPQPGAGAWARPEDPRRAEADGVSHARWATEVLLCGWQPSCEHGDGEARCLVLDPFAGSGTTGRVATELGRNFVGLEQNPDSAEMAREQIASWEADPCGLLDGDPEPLPGQLSIEAAFEEGGEPASVGVGDSEEARCD